MKKELYLPCMRGCLGDWVYYVCMMKLGEVSSRVSFAEIIHNNKALSDLIQRKLNDGRGREIKEYLLNNKERFFNSMIVAVYGGDPEWFELGGISSKHKELTEMDDSVLGGLGILRFNGAEKLYALDGQHRLAGIKQSVKESKKLAEEDLSVIFVAHKKTVKGFERSRRLFTILNKTAKKVSKGEIIALDEDEVMAIITRRLIEESDIFSEDKISYQKGNNIPSTNKTSLTTIENLYDLLEILYKNIIYNKDNNELKNNRPTDVQLDKYYSDTLVFFKLLFKKIPSLKEFYSDKYTDAVLKYRTKDGGSIYYRPIGLSIIFTVLARLRKKYTVEDAVNMIAKLPSDLSLSPYKGIVWHPTNKTIITRGKALCIRLLLFMLNEEKNEVRLLNDYKKAMGEGYAGILLPDKLVP